MVRRTVLFAVEPDELDPVPSRVAAALPHLVVDAEEAVGEGVTTTHLVDPQGGAAVAVTVDHQMPAAYAVVKADDEDGTARLVATLRSIGVVDREEQRARVAAASGPDLGTELIRLAVLVRDDEWETAELDDVRRGLDAADPSVRADAAMALALRPDRRPADAVEQALRAETDEEAQAVLAYLWQLLEQS
ncbi:MAG TPA: hypothetical protein VGO60_13725 [Iamia sp.]|jgi:hypothetical protein|nr:hypothetical protein [Iamia sp.]